MSRKVGGPSARGAGAKRSRSTPDPGRHAPGRPYDAPADEQPAVLFVLEEDDRRTAKAEAVHPADHRLQRAAAHERGAQPADIRDGWNAERRRGDRSVDIGLDRIAEVSGRPKLARKSGDSSEKPEIGPRIEARSLDGHDNPLHPQCAHPLLGRGILGAMTTGSYPASRSAAIRPVRKLTMFQSLLADRTMGRRGAGTRQALSSWNRGISTSKALPSSSTMR